MYSFASHDVLPPHEANLSAVSARCSIRHLRSGIMP